MSRRVMGKASFFHVQDMSGRIQLYVQRDVLPDGVYEQFQARLDLGDIVGAEGRLFKTKTGELSVQCDELRLLTKALRPLPEKFHGLTDQESRYRQRYLDLIMNEASRRTFQTRTRVVQFIRSYLDRRGFLEVETPMMQVIPGGRDRAAVHHASQRRSTCSCSCGSRPELLPEAAVVGGFEKSTDQPQLPQRGVVHATQPRVQRCWSSTRRTRTTATSWT